MVKTGLCRWVSCGLVGRGMLENLGRRVSRSVLIAWRIRLLMTLFAAAGPLYAAEQAHQCPSLLMGFECAQFQQRLKLSHNATERGQVITEYEYIQKERSRLCPLSAARHTFATGGQEVMMVEMRGRTDVVRLQQRTRY